MPAGPHGRLFLAASVQSFQHRQQRAAVRPQSGTADALIGVGQLVQFGPQPGGALLAPSGQKVAAAGQMMVPMATDQGALTLILERQKVKYQIEHIAWQGLGRPPAA